MAEPVKQLPEFKIEGVPWGQLRLNWSEYRKEFKYIVKSLSKSKKKQVKTLFLNMAGREIQRVVESLDQQDLEEQLSDDGLEAANEIEEYRQMMTKLDEYFAPKRHEILERQGFHGLHPSDEETLDKFLIRLKAVAGKCNFGSTETESRQIAIVDKMAHVAGPDLKEKILKKDWSMDSFTRFINSHVQSKEDTKTLTESHTANMSVAASIGASRSNLGSSFSVAGPSHETVARIYDKKGPECPKCGYDHKKEDFCPAANVTCNECGKIGHYKRKCFFANTNNNRPRDDKRRRYNPPTQQRKQQFHKRQKVNYVELSSDEGEKEEPLTDFVNAIGNSLEATMFLSVGGVLMQMLVDSGCKFNLITDRTFEYLKRNEASISNIREANIGMSAYGQKSKLTINCKFDATLALETPNTGRRLTTTFYVIRGGTQNLLGRQTASEIGVLRIGLPVEAENWVSNVSQNRPVFPHIKGKINN